MKIALNLLQYQDELLTKLENDKQYVFDPIRKKYLVLLPEELVRQLLLIHLSTEAGFPLSRINVEKQLKVLRTNLRFDIVVYDKNSNPEILVECKAPSVKIKQDTFEQISKYNLKIKAKYLIVTNGIDTYCCEMDYANQSYDFIPNLPKNSSRN